MKDTFSFGFIIGFVFMFCLSLIFDIHQCSQKKARISITNSNISHNPNLCHEYDTTVLDGSKRMVLHFTDCQGIGTISVSTNKPIFGRAESARIMGTDDVIGLDAVGYGFRLDNESDRRTCKVKYQHSRQAVTDTILSIFYSFR